MRKAVVVIILGVMGLSACTYQTCPTYAKSPKQEVKKSRQI